eukprot:scaffold31809_cov38-Attheya_sp.AAC.5
MYVEPVRDTGRSPNYIPVSGEKRHTAPSASVTAGARIPSTYDLTESTQRDPKRDNERYIHGLEERPLQPSVATSAQPSSRTQRGKSTQ